MLFQKVLKFPEIGGKLLGEALFQFFHRYVDSHLAF